MGEENSFCPIVNAMKLLGGKWKLPILFRLMGGQTRFSALASLIPDVSRKVLSEQLKQMEKDGLVHRKQFDQNPPKVEYSLTQHAQKLKPILEDLCRWNKSSMNPPE
jgi:DNA-binding HxlR family transcriptional regulator